MNTVDFAYTRGKTKLSLSLLGSGGEGAVYEIDGHPNLVAKIYHDESSDQRSQREAKIDAMVAISQSFAFKSAALSDDIAWPIAPLYDSVGNFIGFGMNRISASTELDDLYEYPSNNNSTVTIRDRVKCLISLCDVIDRLHQTGQVFGDFNPNNIKIRPDRAVSFVDADSYHISYYGKEYRCVVCAPGYVAPEIISACKGTTYADCPGTTFTRETDCFALAIHIFRMLMNGCHPYICERNLKRAGSSPAPKSIDKRVESGETPFFKSIPNYVAPQYAPDINTLPPYLYDLFRKAFVDGHTNPTARPKASEWKSALIRYSSELRVCQSNHNHYYWKENESCPYCAADLRYNIKMQLASSKNTSGNSPNSNGIYSAKATKAVAPTYSNHSNAVRFWLTTLAIDAAALIVLGIYILPSVYRSAFDNEVLAIIGVVGSLVAGVIGTLLFNCKWSPGRISGTYKWWDYIFSPLTAVGFVIGFGIAMGLVILALYILFYIFIGALIISLIVGILSGG